MLSNQSPNATQHRSRHLQQTEIA